MTTTSTDIDKVVALFEKKQLTAIRDRPTFRTLTIIKGELCANAGRIRSTLGGGRHGHLGLVLSNDEYITSTTTADIAAVPFVRPVQPIQPEILPTTANHVAVRLRMEYERDLRQYDLANNTEEALLAQLVDTIPPIYMQQYRDTTTNLINQSLREILQRLFSRYGKVTQTDLNREENEVKKYVHDIEQPLVLLFEKVEYLQKMSVAVRNAYTLRQQIELGLFLIQATGDFKEGLRKFYDDLYNNETTTWVDFKQHFEDELETLEQVRGNLKSGYMYEHANALQRMQDELDSTRDTLLGAIHQTHSEAINNASSTRDDEIAAKMNEFEERLKQIQTCYAATDTQTKKKKKYAATPDGRPFWEDPAYDYKYCWSHGACNHTGMECNRKKEGHKDEATFNNRMGGRTWRFPTSA